MIRIIALAFLLVGCSSTQPEEFDFDRELKNQLASDVERCYYSNSDMYDLTFSSDFININCYNKVIQRYLIAGRRLQDLSDPEAVD